MFLPRNARPPYQTVVYFPSSVAFLLESSENLADMTMLSFLPRAGRALVYPIYKGTYERRITDGAGGPAGIRQRTIWQTQDLPRTVDYIEERDDLRQDALVYMGISYGGEIAVPVAIEKRFDALVLVGGALDAASRTTTPPEAAPWNFVSRITTPTLLINGRNDTMHHYETGQIPFFEAIDVPAADKRFVVLDAGHVPPWNDVIRYTLDWLDERLGTAARQALRAPRSSDPRPVRSSWPTAAPSMSCPPGRRWNGGRTGERPSGSGPLAESIPIIYISTIGGVP